jgi:hypothetical protein
VQYRGLVVTSVSSPRKHISLKFEFNCMDRRPSLEASRCSASKKFRAAYGTSEIINFHVSRSPMSSLLFNRPNNIWWRGQNMKFLINFLHPLLISSLLFIIQFNSLFIYVLSSTANGQLESARIQTTAAIRQHRTKQTKNNKTNNKKQRKWMS